MRQLGPGHYAQLASGPEPGPRCDTGRRHRTAGRHVHGLRGQADHHRHARSVRLELERVVRKARRSGERSTPRRYKAMWPREAERGSKRVLSITGSRSTENLARAIRPWTRTARPTGILSRAGAIPPRFLPENPLEPAALHVSNRGASIAFGAIRLPVPEIAGHPAAPAYPPAHPLDERVHTPGVFRLIRAPDPQLALVLFHVRQARQGRAGIPCPVAPLGAQRQDHGPHQACPARVPGPGPHRPLVVLGTSQQGQAIPASHPGTTGAPPARTPFAALLLDGTGLCRTPRRSVRAVALARQSRPVPVNRTMPGPRQPLQRHPRGRRPSPTGLPRPAHSSPLAP